MTKPDPDQVQPAAPRKRRSARTGLGGRLFLLALAFGIVVLGFELVGKPIRLPVFLVAEIESRLNASLGEVMPGTQLSVGGIEVVVGSDWVPHLSLSDLQMNRDGATLLTLPETELSLDPRPILQGQLRARSLRVSGATITVRRDAEGRFDFAFGSGQGPKIANLGAVLAMLDKTFASPGLAGFHQLNADALSLTFIDAISGRTWQVGDGHFAFENRKDELAAELGVTLLGQDGVSAQADLTVVSVKGKGAARITATVDHVAAADLAAQTPVLGFLGALDAPISGQIAATLDTSGVQAMDGRLDIAAGAIKPSAGAAPLAFDHASLALGYDPREGRIRLGEVSVQSRTLRLTAEGQALLVDAAGKVITGPLDGRRPDAFLGQVRFDDVQVDPEGIFAAPVHFSQGALDAKLRLAPFALTIGQFSLAEGDQRFVLHGKVVAKGDKLDTALDLSVNKISRAQLLALWPPKLVTGTRNWIVDNLSDVTLTDIRAALRQVTGETPELELDYAFKGATFRFMKQMPPVEDADGYSTIQGKVYTLVMDRGIVRPPQGGTLDMAGSVLQVPDILAKPATGNFHVAAKGSLTATLSILDQAPFHFLTKAGRPVDLGEGTVETHALLSLPLIGKIGFGDVTYDAKATIHGFRSDKLVKGKWVTADDLAVQATPKGMTIKGPGQIGAVPFDVTYGQVFGPTGGAPTVDGTVTLGPVAVKEFHIGLPDGSVKGEGPANVHLTLPKGGTPELHLTSDTAGLVLSLPEIGWHKGAATLGNLVADVALDTVPHVTHIALTAAGLAAEGSVSLTPDGSLDVARLGKVKIANWFDGAVDIKGRGASKPVGLQVKSGKFDLRNFPSDRGSGGGADGGPLDVTLDRLQVTDSIHLSKFRGNFTLRGGFNGQFQGALMGQVPISGEVAPSKYGTAVHFQGEDAGAAARAVGMFSAAYGGQMDVTLVPQASGSRYDGKATIGALRVRYGSVLADLLNAISVVGLLEQLNGEGIAFTKAEARFALSPDAVLLQKGSAIGASMGILLSGLYNSQSRALDMQGVVSPIYLLNGIGAFLTRKGEGLFGFNYRLKGTAENPAVSVNPLSILTPGMFREIFRSPPPTLPESGN